MSTIADYMTPQPWAIQVDDSLSLAREMLAERNIHHLPVLDGEHLVGMLVQRDLTLAAGQVAPTVEEFMTSVHYVDVATPLEEVLQRMDSRGWDAVVVTSGEQRIEGIFTAMDAVRVLGEVLEAHPDALQGLPEARTSDVHDQRPGA